MLIATRHESASLIRATSPEDLPVNQTLKALFLTVEVNLLLWLAALGLVLGAGEDVGALRTLIIVGTVFAAIAQHWAYYAVRRQTKQTQP